MLSSEVASQVAEHAQFGGVVPELASRRHVEALPVLVERALQQAQLPLSAMDAVAATVAPGLSGALLVGSVTGRSLARLAGVPFVGIHHLEGHLCSALSGDPAPELPLLVLLVSGGHTELIAMRAEGDYERLGGSHDDAAGEAFDKVARLLGWVTPAARRSRPQPAVVIPIALPFRRGGSPCPGVVFIPMTSVSAASKPLCCAKWSAGASRETSCQWLIWRLHFKLWSAVCWCSAACAARKTMGSTVWWWSVVSRPTALCGSGCIRPPNSAAWHCIWPHWPGAPITPR